ncbi:MAG: hypothetical protein JWP97_5417 [Labilithrix sp.]|nr:hypothetical protein [Labilithrix sp.]
MTARDVDAFLDCVLAADLDALREEARARDTEPAPAYVAAEQHRALHRDHELAADLMRAGANAEIRTWARLRVLEIEREMV